MARHGRMPTYACAVAVALYLAVASSATRAAREGPPIMVEVASLQQLRETAERATPGSVIRLAAGIYPILADDPPFIVKGVHGLPDQPIVIRGATGVAGSRPAIIDGSRRLDGMLGMIERFGQPGGDHWIFNQADH